MELWYVLAFILLAVAAVTSAVHRTAVMALLCAGLACWVLPLAWAAIRT